MSHARAASSRADAAAAMATVLHTSAGGPIRRRPRRADAAPLRPALTTSRHEAVAAPRLTQQGAWPSRPTVTSGGAVGRGAASAAADAAPRAARRSRGYRRPAARDRAPARPPARSGALRFRARDGDGVPGGGMEGRSGQQSGVSGGRQGPWGGAWRGATG